MKVLARLPLRPTLSSMRRHRLTVVLLLLQVAFTFAIVCNASFLLARRIRRVTVPSGLVEAGLSLVHVSEPGHGRTAAAAQADVAALRALADVQGAAIVDGLPLSGGASAFGTCGDLDAVHQVLKAHSMNVPGCGEPASFRVGPGALRVLGLRLVAGRDFRDQEYAPGHARNNVSGVPAVIVSRALARRLFGQGHAVGRMVYFGHTGFAEGVGCKVVGVVEHLQRWSLHAGSDDEAMLVPSVPAGPTTYFAVRSPPAQQARVLRDAEALLSRRHPDRAGADAGGQTYAQIRADYFQRDATMVGLLLSSAVGLLFVTALGIAGLASFWVQQRRRSIGVRRAMGATRADIMLQFQAENLLVVVAGVALGVVAAYALSAALMRSYELPLLPLGYVPGVFVLLLLVGQLAVLAPALRAAAVPPIVVSRG